MKLNLFSPDLDRLRYQSEFEDDFLWYISPHFWTSLAADGGSSVAMTTGDDGLLLLTTGAVNNNEVAVISTNALWTFTTGKTFYGEVLLQFTEAGVAGNEANVAFGFSSAAAADVMVDDGAGMATTHSSACIFKVDGGTTWKTHTSNSTTQTNTTSVHTAGGSSYQRLGIELRDVDGTNMEVTYFLDTQPMKDSTFRRPIKHSVAIASAAAMKFFVYVKCGTGTSQTLKLDYAAGLKARTN